MKKAQINNKVIALIGFFIGIVVGSVFISLWSIPMDKKLDNMYISQDFVKNHVNTIAIIQDYDNEIVTAEYTGILLERQAKDIERIHDVAVLHFSKNQEKITTQYLADVLNSLEILHTKILNEEKIIDLEENIVQLNDAVKKYIEAIN